MKSVAIEEIQAVWGTKKNIEKCSLGKGFGSKYERAGGQAQDQTPKDIEAPTC